jgi:hypothetical protein
MAVHWLRLLVEANTYAYGLCLFLHRVRRRGGAGMPY